MRPVVPQVNMIRKNSIEKDQLATLVSRKDRVGRADPLISVKQQMKRKMRSVLSSGYGNRDSRDDCYGGMSASVELVSLERIVPSLNRGLFQFDTRTRQRQMHTID